MNVDPTKETLRRDVQKRLARQDAFARQHAGLVIQDKVLMHAEFERAAVIGCYLALPAEVQTARLISRGQREGKEICVPAYDPAMRAYRFAVLPVNGTMTSGPMNIPEPATPEWVEVDALSLMIVPGVAFDRRGGRVGHGAGHYDRLIGSREQAGLVTCGLAYELQMFEQVPMEDTDQYLNFVVTEGGDGWIPGS
mgnify:CR=1 FL=1